MIREVVDQREAERFKAVHEFIQRVIVHPEYKQDLILPVQPRPKTRGGAENASDAS